MSLLGPDDEDIKKIHSEINQIVNQRFLLLTFAITALGVMLTLIINKLPPNTEFIDLSFYLISTLFLAIFFSIFLLSRYLLYMLRILSIYLIITYKSNWEIDWVNYRKNCKYIGYSKHQTIIFLIFGGITTALPFLIQYNYSLQLRVNFVFVFFTASYICYFFFVSILGFRKLQDREESIEKNWQELRDN